MRTTTAHASHGCASILAVLTLMLATPALAQERSVVELAGGYQYMADITAEESFPRGFFASAGWNATNWLAIVGEFATSGKTIDSDRVDVYTSMGGIRLRRGGFFGQVLIGQFALRLDEQRSNGRLEQTITDTAIQPGVGWDIRVTSRVFARVQVDYRQLLSDEDEFGRQVRVAAGVSVGLGGR